MALIYFWLNVVMLHSEGNIYWHFSVNITDTEGNFFFFFKNCFCITNVWTQNKYSDCFPTRYVYVTGHWSKRHRINSAIRAAPSGRITHCKDGRFQKPYRDCCILNYQKYWNLWYPEIPEIMSIATHLISLLSLATNICIWLPHHLRPHHSKLYRLGWSQCGADTLLGYR